MDWPAYLPDLNPIEHVWDMLGRRIADRQPPPTCLPELRRPLLDEWCNIPQDQIDNLILSMPRRCQLKKLLRTPNKPLQQICGRIFENQQNSTGIDVMPPDFQVVISSIHEEGTASLEGLQFKVAKC
ncbi:hypothetical protein AVEN_95107-1 [Araneus ventricosus]|uniref:Tc1-like transposase DDE domain-containing protein n=1 Tax=Araneus ventricosus TaxID=182803 RepID=A0A4Y2WKF4_ARAVE|nr:hypothetical protein AVEN_95107-1 [Araneus ventricosus]